VIKVVVEFVAEATVKTTAYVYDDDDALVDPAGCTAGAEKCVSLKITDHDGTVLVPSEGDGDDIMTRSDKGIYEHYLYTDADYVKGWYQGQVKTTDGQGTTAKVSFGHFSFRIK